MIKATCCLAILLFTITSVSAQETIDKRLDKNEKNLLQPAENFKNEQGQSLTYAEASAETFNYYDYGIRIAKEQRLYIALDAEHVLVFHSIPELSKLFSNSEFNTKK